MLCFWTRVSAQAAAPTSKAIHACTSVQLMSTSRSQSVSGVAGHAHHQKNRPQDDHLHRRGPRWIDELRQESEEEQCGLRIQDVDRDAFLENLTERFRAVRRSNTGVGGASKFRDP